MKKEIVIYRESLWQSIVSDIFTFGILVGSFAVNQYFIGSGLLAGFLLILFFVFVIGKTTARKNVFTDKKKAIDHINSLDV